MAVSTRQELMREYANRARAFGLTVDCPMDGVFNAQIAVVCEAPGEMEVRNKLPLCGGTGQFLWQVLKKYQLTRQHVYITHVVKRKVSMSARVNLKNPVHKGELQHWKDLLLWELKQLPNLKYILVLGNYALGALANETGITNWRGTVKTENVGDKEVTLIIANNPADVLRTPKLEVVFRMDIGKLDKVLQGKFIRKEIEALVNPSFHEAMTWIDKMQDEKLPVAFDIETMSNETACIGLANTSKQGMCINFRTLKDNYFSTREEKELMQRFQTLFEDENVKLVAQNGIFDSYWMWYKDRIKVHKVWFDTLLAHHTLYPLLPHNLGFLCSQYTTHPFYKDEGKAWKDKANLTPEAIDDFWRYNVKDVCTTIEVMNGEHNELRQAGLEEFFFNHVMRLQPHLVAMTVGGVLIDTVLKNQIAEDLREHVAILEQEFHELVDTATGHRGIRVNPRSPVQLRDLFFNKLHLVGIGTSTNEQNRQNLKAHRNTPGIVKRMLDKLDEYKTEDKFLGTYAEMQVGVDNRIRCEYKQYGTQNAPGRLSSAKVAWGEGMNLQNQPERAHPMFIADEGYGFGYFDLAQAEARVVGWLANIETWMEQFERARMDGSYDCHRALASEMWGILYDEVPKEDRVDGVPTLRYIAKRCRHGLNYRMAADRLAQTTGLSPTDATKAYNLYHTTTPELRQWWDALLAEVRKNKMLFNSYGRRMIFLERITEDSTDSIVAYKPQSTIGDKVCRVIYKSHEDDRWPMHCKIKRIPRARMVLNIHDALICLAPHNKMKTCLAVMKEHAEEPLMINGKELIIPADLGMSEPDEWGKHRWSTIKKLKEL